MIAPPRALRVCLPGEASVSRSDQRPASIAPSSAAWTVPTQNDATGLPFKLGMRRKNAAGRGNKNGMLLLTPHPTPGQAPFVLACGIVPAEGGLRRRREMSRASGKVLRPRGFARRP